MFTCEISHRRDIFGLGVILYNSTGVHNVAAVLCYAVYNLFTVLTHLIGRSHGKQVVRYTAADTEFMSNLLMHLKDISLVNVINNRLVRQLSKGL